MVPSPFPEEWDCPNTQCINSPDFVGAPEDVGDIADDEDAEDSDDELDDPLSDIPPSYRKLVEDDEY